MFEHDVVVVGSGISALQSALSAAQKGANVAVVSKVHPLRSHPLHTSIAAAFSKDDKWSEHMYESVFASEYLADQDAVEAVTKEARQTIIDLEHLGVIFSRNEQGMLDTLQGPGHSKKRSAYSQDKLGKLVLQTLYDAAVQKNITLYVENIPIKLVIIDNITRGLIALSSATGELRALSAKAVIIADDGIGQLFESSTNPLSSTGDGLALALRQGIPLKDMEFMEYHPLGLLSTPYALSENVLSQKAQVVNRKGEQFVSHYTRASHAVPLDIVCKSISSELSMRRGIDGKQYVHLDLRPMTRAVIGSQMYTSHTLIQRFEDVDAQFAPVPVVPRAHYLLGGIPCDLSSTVMKNEKGEVVMGLFAAGESACHGVHGASPMGGNVLLTEIFFAKRAGESAEAFAKKHDKEPLPDTVLTNAKKAITAVLRNEGKESVTNLRKELQKVMQAKCGITKTQANLSSALKKVTELQKRYKSISLTDKKTVFNSELREALELKAMLDIAPVIIKAAQNRKETRGCHVMSESKKRNDKEFLKHSFVKHSEKGLELTYQSVNLTTFEPKERRYQ